MNSYYIWVNGDFVHPKHVPAGLLSDGEENAVSVVRDFRIYETDSGPAIFRLAEHIRQFLELVRREGIGLHFNEDQLCDTIHRTIMFNDMQEGLVRTRLIVKKDQDTKHAQMGSGPDGVVLAIIPQDYYAEAGASKSAARKPAGRVLDNDVPRHASLFLVKDRTILTPPSKIFGNSMVRNSVVTLAFDLGFEVMETPIDREQIFDADEVFLSTAVGELEYVSQFNSRTIGSGQIGPVTRSLQSTFYATMQGRGKRSREWLEWIGAFFLGI